MSDVYAAFIAPDGTAQLDHFVNVVSKKHLYLLVIVLKCKGCNITQSLLIIFLAMSH